MGLTKRPDSYYVEFRVIDSADGKSLVLASGVQGARKKRWKVGCLNKTVAREMEAAIKTRILLGQEQTEQAKPVLFKEWAKTYLDMESVKTLRSYQDRVEIMGKQLIPFFGGKILGEIKPADVETYRGQRKKRNGSMASTQTINNDHIVLKHALNVAVRRDLLVSNPAARVPMPDPQNARDRVLSEEEWGKLYQAAKPHLQPVLLLAYQLGQRLSEIVNLTWDRVDLKRGFVTLRSQDTKTKKPRQVPITPDVRGTLQQLAKLRSLATRHVFLYQGEPLKDFRTAFRTALKDAGVIGFKFHDLRHCAATNLRRAGVDTTTAMQIVGHTSPQMWKRYNHIREEDLSQAATKLGKYLQQTTPRTLDGQAESR
ncbi:tyrosine-type recombinase/integrase [Nitrospira lenta]|uniref:Putative Integrase family protein n=1 Tax=Nitrospira lenta TaxID=1436998 RepID=A0A330L5V7_9BACT|nr:site-specific integrase [Nitrospira lenta]SPP65229.1 putative Integrase family protein [Nitrospira lenta]